MFNLVQLALQAGFEQAAPLRVETLELRPEVRDMCAADRCNMYGKSWMCPPACGTLAENAKALEGFTSGVLVQTIGPLEDSFDYEGMQAAEALHKQRLHRLHRQLKQAVGSALLLGSGGCGLCESCTYPDAECRSPEWAMPSMEAYGLWVSDVCKKNDLAYNYGPGKIAYTGCVLVDE